MNVAIGIHVRAEPQNLLHTVESLWANTALPFSLLLLPDGPDAETTAALVRLSGLQQLGTPDTRGAPACFNRLMSKTGADVVIFLESGVRVGPGWLEHLLRAFESDQHIGLAGPSTNLSWNEQASFPNAEPGPDNIARTAQDAFDRFGTSHKTLEPLYSLADFCYAVRREVFNTIGEADELYGLGPCWEMDYNIRAARAGFQGVWVCASYVYRPPLPERRLREQTLHFEASRRRYQDRFCGLRLTAQKQDYRPHCLGDACPNFAPPSLIWISSTPPSSRVVAMTAPVQQNQPLISCIMPTHNRREFVPRVIECFNRQDYPNLELIIVDSGSDPVGDLVPDDPRVRYFRLSQRLTTGAMRNRACQFAQGEIIMHWDDDDWYPAHRVRVQALPIITGQADITGAASIYFYEPSSGRAFLYQYQGNQKPFVIGSTLAYRRGYWQRHPFTDIQVAEDCYFVWNAPLNAVLDLKDPALCVASIHAGNTSPRDTAAHGWNPVLAETILAIMDEHTGGHPLVSCIMPTFNRRPLIPLALECFHAQTYPCKELIVVDDGSDPVGDLFQGIPEVRYLRTPRRLTIGAKRNLACREARGEMIAHWDDDDWYAPRRLQLQVAPLLARTADLTGLVNRFVLEMPYGRFWTTVDHLHRRMFFGDVHGGTLVYRKAILRERIAYPEVDLAEDASLIDQALRRNKRLMRLENPGVFVYLRHGGNAWRFEVGRFLDPTGWRTAAAPPGFSPQLLDLYRHAIKTNAATSALA